jgi:hypothetical protein
VRKTVSRAFLVAPDSFHPETMKKPKLNFGNKTILEQLAICRRVADGAAKLPAEHREKIAEHDVAGRTEEAQQANAEVESLKIALKSALRQRDEKVRAARDASSAAAGLIFIVTNGNAAAMLAAGLDIVRDKQPVGLPDAPGQLRVLPVDFEGTVRLRWKRPVRRCSFIVEATTDPAAQTGWKRQLTCFKQSCTVKDLAGGKKYWLRVAAANAHGQGPWSQPVSAWVK